MATFKDVSVYFEVGGSWLDAAFLDDSPLSVPEVLKCCEWRFKGGSLLEAAAGGSRKVEVMDVTWPDGMCNKIAESYAHAELNDWKAIKDDSDSESHVHSAKIFRDYLRDRKATRKHRMDKASLAAHVATFAAATARLREHESPYPIEKAFIVQGAAAIYEAAYEMVSTARARPSSDTFEPDSKLSVFVQEMVFASSVGSSLHPATAESLCKTICSILAKTNVSSVMACWKDVDLIRRSMISGFAKREALEFGQTLLEEYDDVTCEEATDDALRWGKTKTGIYDTCGNLRFHTTQMVAWCEMTRSRVLVFGKSAIVSLQQTLMAYCSQLVATVADAVCARSGGIKAAVERGTHMATITAAQMLKIYKTGSGCSPGNHVRVCKSYKKAFAAYHARLAGPQAKADIAVLDKEAKSVGEVRARDLEDYWTTLMSLTAQEAHNYGKTFKICPPPDVSPGQTMIDRVKAVKNPNVFNPRYGDVVVRELEIQIVFARARMSGPKVGLKEGVAMPTWWPNYLRNDWENVPVDDLPATLAWEGTLTLPTRSELDPSVWKDSSVGADTLFEGISGGRDDNMRNMKTRMLFDVDVPSPATNEVNNEAVVEMLIKGEGHKDPARAIFSSNMRHRFRQGLLEVAVQDVAKHHPSFMIGVTPESYDRVELEVTSPSCSPGYVPRYYSFDVSSWSASMSRLIQEKSRAIWDRLYATKMFSECFLEMADAHVYINKAGYVGSYKNTGSNMEGFDGKHMTMINVAMLAATVKVWRTRAVAENICNDTEARHVKATLLAYIDDGMAKINFPTIGAAGMADRCFALFRAVSNEVFSDASFTLDPPKCFPSDCFYVFLNEVYIAGRHIMHGSRAASTICGEPMEEHLSFPECAEKISNSCRGAAKSGTEGLGVMILQAYHLFHLTKEWATVTDAVTTARWMITPRALGGVGVPTQLQMTSTAAGEPLAEGINVLQLLSAATHFDGPLLGALVSSEFKVMTPASILVAPLSVRVVNGYLDASGLAVLVRLALEKMRATGRRMSAIATEYMRFADPAALDDYASVVVPSSGPVQEVYLDAAAEAHPQKVFSEFSRSIESSRTLRRIVGWAEYRKLLNRNKTSAKESIHLFENKMIEAMARSVVV